MADPHRPLKPADKKPGEVPPDIPETDDPERDFAEGQLPGMPVSRDPLLNPGPTPGQVEREPRD